MKPEVLDEYLEYVKKSWPDCAGIRRVAKTWELAILNAMGGKHWISLATAPKAAEDSVNRYTKYRKKMTELKCKEKKHVSKKDS